LHWSSIRVELLELMLREVFNLGPTINLNLATKGPQRADN
jgi:hypothetical protein